MLNDRQRIELATPAYLLYALTGAPDVFIPAAPDLAARAEADVAALRGNLRTACLEPFADLTPTKRQALLRRLDRVKRQATADWHNRPALGLMLMLWCFLRDLTDRKILVLWEGSAMDLGNGPGNAEADAERTLCSPAGADRFSAVYPTIKQPSDDMTALGDTLRFHLLLSLRSLYFRRSTTEQHDGQGYDPGGNSRRG